MEVALLADCQRQEIAFHQRLLCQEVILQLATVELQHGRSEELAIWFPDLFVGEHLRGGTVVHTIFNMCVGGTEVDREIEGVYTLLLFEKRHDYARISLSILHLNMVKVVVSNRIVLCLVVGSSVLVAAIHYHVGNLLVTLEELQGIFARIGGNATHGIERILLLTETDERHHEAGKVKLSHSTDIVLWISLILSIEIAGIFHILIPGTALHGNAKRNLHRTTCQTLHFEHRRSVHHWLY